MSRLFSITVRFLLATNHPFLKNEIIFFLEKRRKMSTKLFVDEWGCHVWWPFKMLNNEAVWNNEENTSATRNHDMPFKCDKTRQTFEWPEHKQYLPTVISKLGRRGSGLTVETPLHGISRTIERNGATYFKSDIDKMIPTKYLRQPKRKKSTQAVNLCEDNSAKRSKNNCY